MTEPRDVEAAAERLSALARRRQAQDRRDHLHWAADPRDPRRAYWAESAAQRSTDMGSSGPERMRESAKRHRRGAALCYDGTPAHHWHTDVDPTTTHVVRCCWCRRRETLAELTSYKPIDFGEALLQLQLQVRALWDQLVDQLKQGSR